MSLGKPVSGIPQRQLDVIFCSFFMHLHEENDILVGWWIVTVV
jgi:hypothetical protein